MFLLITNFAPSMSDCGVVSALTSPDGLHDEETPTNLSRSFSATLLEAVTAELMPVVKRMEELPTVAELEEWEV